MSWPASYDPLKRGARVQLLENTCDDLLNIWYCGKKAELIDIHKGSLVEVKILDKTQKELFWPAACVLPLDVIDMLDDESLTRVFSFLVGPPKPRPLDATLVACDHDKHQGICGVNKRWRYLAQKRFILGFSTIVNLHIKLGDNASDYFALNHVVSGMKALERLTIVEKAQEHLRSECIDAWINERRHLLTRDDRCLHIKSDTLLHLDVSLMAQGSFVTCRCPKLKSFVCKAEGCNVNGSLPFLTKEQFELFQSGRARKWEMRTSLAPFVGMEVHPKCLCKVSSFKGFLRDTTFDKYSNQLLARIRSSQEKCLTVAKVQGAKRAKIVRGANPNLSAIRFL